jgi:DNA-binding MarR family transcriptional regulator
MGLRRQSVQRLVDAMVVDGLLTLSENPNHKRARLVDMTEQGRARYASIMARHRSWANGLGEGLDPAAIAAGVALVEELARRVGDQDASEAPR